MFVFKRMHPFIILTLIAKLILPILNIEYSGPKIWLELL